MTSHIIKSASLGFPRIGAKRELKTALEQFWKGNISKDDLLKTAADLRKRHWKLQKDKKQDERLDGYDKDMPTPLIKLPLDDIPGVGRGMKTRLMRTNIRTMEGLIQRKIR